MPPEHHWPHSLTHLVSPFPYDLADNINLLKRESRLVCLGAGCKVPRSSSVQASVLRRKTPLRRDRTRGGDGDDAFSTSG